MVEPTHALISLEDRYAEAILNGSKRVELRRRPMNVPLGATIWFYVKVPVGSVIGCAQVQSIHSLAPSTLWRRFGRVSGLHRAEFFQYFSGISKGFAVVLEKPCRLMKGITLDQMRCLAAGFQPPQFFQRITDQEPLLDALLQVSQTSVGFNGVD